MDELNLYDDLEEFHEEHEKKSKELQELEEKLQQSHKIIEELQTENKTLKKNIRNMELNFQSLLDTARSEIKRKDREIERLNREKDNICFRRNISVKPATTKDKQQLQHNLVVNPFRCNKYINEDNKTITEITKNPKMEEKAESNKRYRDADTERNHSNDFKRHRSVKGYQDDYSKNCDKIKDHGRSGRTYSRENIKETMSNNKFDRNRSRDRKEKIENAYEKFSKSSESPERYCRQSDRSREREKIYKRYQNADRNRSRDRKNTDKYSKTYSRSPQKQKFHIDLNNASHSQNNTLCKKAEKAFIKDLREKKSNVLKGEEQSKLEIAHNSQMEKGSKTKSDKLNSGILNVNIPNKNVEQEKTEKNSDGLLKNAQKRDSVNDLNKESENNTQKDITTHYSNQSSMSDTNKLCTPRKVALFNEIFGKSPGEISTVPMSSICSNSLLNNIKDIIAKTSQVEVISSATTSPGDYTDMNSNTSTPIGKTVEIISSASNTSDSIINVRNNQTNGTTLKNICDDGDEIDKCFIPTQSGTQNVETIACVDLTKVVENDIANEVEFVQIPGLDLCNNIKLTPIEIQENDINNTTNEVIPETVYSCVSRETTVKSSATNTFKVKKILDSEDFDLVTEREVALASDVSIKNVETVEKLKENKPLNNEVSNCENPLRIQEIKENFKNIENYEMQCKDSNYKNISTKASLLQTLSTTVSNKIVSKEKVELTQIIKNVPEIPTSETKSSDIVHLKNQYNTENISQEESQLVKNVEDESLIADKKTIEVIVAESPSVNSNIKTDFQNIKSIGPKDLKNEKISSCTAASSELLQSLSGATSNFNTISTETNLQSNHELKSNADLTKDVEIEKQNLFPITERESLCQLPENNVIGVSEQNAIVAEAVTKHLPERQYETKRCTPETFIKTKSVIENDLDEIIQNEELNFKIQNYDEKLVATESKPNSCNFASKADSNSIKLTLCDSLAFKANNNETSPSNPDLCSKQSEIYHDNNVDTKIQSVFNEDETYLPNPSCSATPNPVLDDIATIQEKDEMKMFQKAEGLINKTSLVATVDNANISCMLTTKEHSAEISDTVNSNSKDKSPKKEANEQTVSDEQKQEVVIRKEVEKNRISIHSVLGKCENNMAISGDVIETLTNIFDSVDQGESNKGKIENAIKSKSIDQLAKVQKDSNTKLELTPKNKIVEFCANVESTKNCDNVSKTIQIISNEAENQAAKDFKKSDVQKSTAMLNYVKEPKVDPTSTTIEKLNSFKYAQLIEQDNTCGHKQNINLDDLPKAAHDLENEGTTQIDAVKEPTDKQFEIIRDQYKPSEDNLNNCEEIITNVELSAPNMTCNEIHDQYNSVQKLNQAAEDTLLKTCSDKSIDTKSQIAENPVKPQDIIGTKEKLIKTDQLSINSIQLVDELELQVSNRLTEQTSVIVESETITNEAFGKTIKESILEETRKRNDVENVHGKMQTSSDKYVCDHNETNKEPMSSSNLSCLDMLRSGQINTDNITLQNQGSNEVFVENYNITNSDISLKVKPENGRDSNTFNNHCTSSAKNISEYEILTSPRPFIVENTSAVKNVGLNKNVAQTQDKPFRDATYTISNFAKKITKEINIEGEIIEVIKNVSDLSETINISKNIYMSKHPAESFSTKIECYDNKASQNILKISIAESADDKQIPLTETKTTNKEIKSLLNEEGQYQTTQLSHPTLFELEVKTKTAAEENLCTVISPTPSDTYNISPVLPSISTISPTPSNFSGIFSKRSSFSATPEDDVTKTKKKSPHFIAKPKEYILPAASVLCNVDNLENATKTNKKLHWELLDNKNETIEIEDDANIDTTNEYEIEIKEELVENASTSIKQTNLQKSLTIRPSLKFSLSKPNTKIKDLRRQKIKNKKLQLSKVQKVKQRKRKFTKNVKSIIKDNSLPHVDTFAGNVRAQQETFSIVLPKRPVRQNTADLLMQQKRRRVKPKTVKSNCGSSGNQRDQTILTEVLKPDNDCLQKTTDSLNDCDRNNRKINNIENIVKNLPAYSEKLENCDEPCSSKDSDKLKKKSIENNVKDYSNENFHNTPVIYHKPDVSVGVINISTTEKSTKKQLQQKEKCEFNIGKQKCIDESHILPNCHVKYHKSVLNNKDIQDGNMINKSECDKACVSGDKTELFVVKDKVIDNNVVPPNKEGEDNYQMSRSDNKTTDEKSITSNYSTKPPLLKNPKSAGSKATTFISLEDLGIKVRPPKLHLSSFRIPKIKKDPEDVVANSWKLETYVELKNEGVNDPLIKSTGHEEEDPKVLQEKKHMEEDIKTVTNEVNQSFSNVSKKHTDINIKLDNTGQTRNSLSSSVASSDRKTKTGKRKLFSVDIHDEERKPAEKSSDQLSKKHEPNSIKLPLKSLHSTIHSTKPGICKRSSAKNSSNSRKKPVNMHRRIFESSCNEDNDDDKKSNKNHKNEKSIETDVFKATYDTKFHVDQQSANIQQTEVMKLSDNKPENLKATRSFKMRKKSLSSSDLEKLTTKTFTSPNIQECTKNVQYQISELPTIKENFNNAESKHFKEFKDQTKPASELLNIQDLKTDKRDQEGSTSEEIYSGSSFSVDLVAKHPISMRRKSTNQTRHFCISDNDSNSLKNQDNKNSEELNTSKQEIKKLSKKVSHNANTNLQITRSSYDSSDSQILLKSQAKRNIAEVKQKVERKGVETRSISSAYREPNLNLCTVYKSTLNQEEVYKEQELYTQKTADSNIKVDNNSQMEDDSDSSVILTQQKTIQIRRKSTNQPRIQDSSSEDNEPLLKKLTVISSEVQAPLKAVTKPKQRKKRVVKVLSTSTESPTNATNTSRPPHSQSSSITSPMLNHPIFNTEISTQSTEFAASMPMTPNQQDDSKFKEIDSKLHEIFESPQYTVDYKITTSVPPHNLTILSPPLNDPPSNITINETLDITAGDNQISSNISQVNESTASLNDTASIINSSEIKHLSLGSADYRFEKVSDNVINLFISRKRKRKRNN